MCSSMVLVWYRCLWNKHSSRCRLCFQSPDPAALISMLTQRYPTAANNNEWIFHRPIALTLHVSVNINILRDGGSRPTLTTSRMSDYFRRRYDSWFDVAQYERVSLRSSGRSPGWALSEGGTIRLKPSSNSKWSIRAFRVDHLIKTRQAVPRRAIRGDSISANSTLPPLRDVWGGYYPSTAMK